MMRCLLIKSYQIPVFAGFPMDFPWISHGFLDFPYGFPRSLRGHAARGGHRQSGRILAGHGLTNGEKQKPMTWGLLTYKLVPITPISLWFMVDITLVYYS